MRGAIALATALLLAWPGPGASAAAQDTAGSGDAKALQLQRRELQSRVENVQRELAASESSRADAADALKTSALAISAANRRLHDLEQERLGLEATLARLDAERGALGGQVRGEQVLLAQLLARQQRGSEHDPLKLLLSGRDPGEINRLLHYFRALGEARARSIANLRADQQRAKALADAAQQQQQRLATLADDEVAQRAILEQERQQQALVLSRVAAEIRRQRRELDHLQRDELRLARLIDRLAELGRHRAPPQPSPLPSPPPSGSEAGSALGARPEDAASAPGAGAGLRRGAVSMPVRGELAGRFGASREAGGTTWKGWFIRCATGQEVRAVAAGQVVYADWLRGFGNLLIVDHGEGYMSLYGNNDALLTQVGAMVRQGEAVAQAGSSGGSVEPGVYFEIRHQGRAVDPAPWIGR